MLKKFAAITLVLFAISVPAFAQVKTNLTALSATAENLKIKEDANYQRAMKLAGEKGWMISFMTNDGNVARLVGVDSKGNPVYYATESNLVAAATTGANQLWSGGSNGLNLSGSSNNVKGKMAVWDGGRVLGTHVELNGRILQKDSPGSFSDHSTHVAGTMVASGVSSAAKGMAYAFQELHAYDYNLHTSEMFSAAAQLLLSNHSYGTLSGWNFNQTLNRWEWYGDNGANEDYNFGYYNTEAQLFDSMAYNAPYYLIVKSAGNNRANNGPSVGGSYYYQSGSGWVGATRQPGMSSNDGYDIISTYGTAKNILTVGAVNGIPAGYNNINDVVMSSFSSWGPTDDGRIKPDVVANGVNLQSSIATSNNSYGIFSGTSMATPNASGSLLLLQEYYSQLHPGNFMLSATLKALAIHCADEAGISPGPDYRFGWGLLNVSKAANVIKSNNLQAHQMFENVLQNGQTYTMNVVASGPLTATLVWTDPKGTVITTNILNNNARRLVNDLDIRITQASNTYMPWILDPASPAAAATTGDNDRDNVEKINIFNAVPGMAYTIQITHKGVLERGQQAYSLILSGVNGQVFCTSAPSSTTGARIDSVGFGSIQHLNPATCTGYSDFTGVSSNVEASQVLPLTVRVNSCDGSTADKIVKAFIDFNNDGDFTDNGENVATSTVINGDGIFTANVTIDAGIVIGNPSVLRIVMQETSNPADVTPCGTYGKGETQDYRLVFSLPSNDLKLEALTELVSPACANPEQLLTVKIQNAGTATQSNLPVWMEVKSGATVISTQNGIYAGDIPVGESRNFTFPVPFNFQAGSSYAITAVVNNNDQNRTNDTLRTNITVAAATAAPSGQGRICGSNVMLLANNAAPNYIWYADPAGAPIGVGLSLTTTTISPNNTYYIGTGARIKAGLTSKSQFPNGGGYLSGTNSFMKYTSTMPFVLETVKLYSKYGGKVEFIVADITSETGNSFTYTTISSKIIDVYATSPNIAAGTQNVYDAADTGAVFHLNLSLPSGSHAIIVKTQGNVNLFRNNNVTGDPYPLGVPGLITFTGNSAATESGTVQNHYYFLYDMRLRTTSCMSARGAVVASPATVPVITRTGNTLTSSISSGNHWHLNGTPISGAFAMSHNATQSGNYTVVTTDIFGCQTSSAAVNVTFTAVNPVNGDAALLQVSPNPGKGSFVLKYKAVRKGDMRIEFLNAQGQVVHNKAYSGFAGELSEQFHLLHLPAGMYVIRLQQDGKTLHKKLLVQ